MATRDHNEIVAAGEAATNLVSCCHNHATIIGNRHRLHGGIEGNVRQKAKLARVGIEILQHLRVVRVVRRAVLEGEVRKAVVVLADVDVCEGGDAVPQVVVAPQTPYAVAALKCVYIKTILFRRLDGGQSTHTCTDDTNASAVLRCRRRIVPCRPEAATGGGRRCAHPSAVVGVGDTSNCSCTILSKGIGSSFD